jgi:hypothetical protein
VGHADPEKLAEIIEAEKRKENLSSQ